MTPLRPLLRRCAIAAIFLAAATAAVAGQPKGAAQAAPLRDKPSETLPAAERRALQERFARADRDGSGGLSRAELAKTPAAAFPNLKKHFRAMDRDRNGEVSLAERDAWVRKQRARRGK